MAASRSAVISACFSSSMAQGPPISTSGRPPPMTTGPMRTSRVRGCTAGSARHRRRAAGPPVRQGGPDEAREQRVGVPRAGAELRVELAGHEVRVVGYLDHLDELLLGPHAGDAQPLLLQDLDEVVVHLVAVPVALVDDAPAVQA